jgi:hypothetical protein
VKTHFEYRARPKTQRLAELEKKTAELERQLGDARESLDRELSHYAHSWETPAEYESELRDFREDADYEYNGESAPLVDMPRMALPDNADRGDHQPYSRETRTATLISRGRPSADRRAPRSFKIGVVAAGAAALLITLIVAMLPGPGATWPASVARVQAEITQACQNPDVRSEPGEVNFACGKTTRQILWVFALLTSGNDPRFAQAGTGRQGLEPISPQQGGVLAWSLNLHHPYDPANPIDSLQVARGPSTTSSAGPP